jgi:cytochrome b561
MLQTYSLTMRLMHWVTATMITFSLVLGFWMTDRSEADIWDELTNTLYAWHKLIGFLILLFTAIRIVVKLKSQKPPYPAQLAAWQIQVAKAVQIAMYTLLILITLFGWAGVTAYPALETLGGLNLPGLPGIPKNEALAKELFEIHGFLIFVLIGIALLHIIAGLNHLWLKKDGVFQRIWFKF